MNARIWCVLFIGLLLSSGCAWQRVEAPPAYAADKYPLTIAIRPSDDPVSKDLANQLATELKTVGGFEGIIYPYRSSDKVDCVLELNAVGNFEGKGAGAGVITGLTFGLTETVVRPETTIIHDVDFYLSNGAQQTEHHKIHVVSEAEFGIFADIQEVAKRQVALQLRKIAIAISEALEKDRGSVMETCTGHVESE